MCSKHVVGMHNPENANHQAYPHSVLALCWRVPSAHKKQTCSPLYSCSLLQYFPSFDELPLMDEYVDPNYYADVGGGTMLPTKHW